MQLNFVCQFMKQGTIETFKQLICMYLFIYCKWTQVRWQNYIDINNIQINIKHHSKILKDIVYSTQFTTYNRSSQYYLTPTWLYTYGFLKFLLNLHKFRGLPYWCCFLWTCSLLFSEMTGPWSARSITYSSCIHDNLNYTKQSVKGKKV
jgi:hypothetical protein